MSSEFVTWGILGTYAGAVSVTTILTQFFKRIPFIRKMDTQILSYIIALVILELSSVFSTGFSWDMAVLCLVNAVVVALASNGVYDVMATKSTSTSKGVVTNDTEKGD